MPPQIGSTAVPCASLSTTIGMFVTGSIMSPRIFISTSIEPSPDIRVWALLGAHPENACGRYKPAQKLSDFFADQAVGSCAGHTHLNILSQKAGARRSEI